ncbi:DNA recombination protein RmuC [Nocardioides panacis]|uniref:DNA recombination protein RmuC n=1 Tax=Nocardioides panacis TaxID=2849501 RepID=A0A975SZU0_9ACTN|nr:DNA recombination protein RmuC [Nocardioides panacis]QWZ08445.1 DNA recombination protein RmuC [Nocardioides panacis]
MDLGTTLSLLLVLLVGLLLGAAVGVLLARARHQPGASPERHVIAQAESRAAEAAVVRESLDRLHDQLRDMAQHGVSWQSQLKQQVEDVRHSTDVLRRETSSLSTALRKPQVRGRWGELHLRRVVELAGLVDRCDFAEQVTARSGDAVLRPDLVVTLAGGKNVVVDAKVPLDAFLDACAVDPGQDSDAVRDGHLARHARQLRQHVDTLAGKAYWRALPSTPEFVVLFVPGESFLSAALEAEPTLLEYAAERQVVLATPTTLIALLRTVAYAWTQQTLADKASEIHELGRDLHERLATMGGHLDRLGRSLTGAVSAYNRAVGSLENRVLVSARRFGDLGVGGDELVTPAVVVDAPRPLTASELLETVAEQRPELPGLDTPDPAQPVVRRVAP